MHDKIPRSLASILTRDARHYPALALVGPRQCGKTTLAKQWLQSIRDGGGQTQYFDLEKPSDRMKLASDPEAFLRRQMGTVCIDEVQYAPALFEVLRALIDEDRRPGRFLLLGSAAPALLKQSSETLAGRIATRELTPFQWRELASAGVGQNPLVTLESLWLRGGFPDSTLAEDDAASFRWRLDFIRTFLERDIPQLGFRVPAQTMERFWRMCAHLHGQSLNLSYLGQALGTSHTAPRNHLDILSGSFMMRLLEPTEANLSKRLVKTPKAYVRDSGLLHALLGLETFNDLDGHPVRGVSWEGFVIEKLMGAAAEGWRASYYRTAQGAELDLILEKGSRRIAFECKASTSPSVTRGFWTSLDDLKITEAYIVAPIQQSFPIGRGIEAIGLSAAVKMVTG
jgi:predicted AAA+ superfamily ATPase